MFDFTWYILMAYLFYFILYVTKYTEGVLNAAKPSHRVGGNPIQCQNLNKLKETGHIYMLVS